MASFAYASAFVDAFKGNIDLDVDTIKVMLVGPGYTPNKDHAKRSDITGEVSGTGYTAGGATATCTVAHDTANDRMELTLGSASWGTATITAYGAVYYKSRGGAASADELIGFNDFGGPITSTGAAFNLAASAIRVPV